MMRPEAEHPTTPFEHFMQSEPLAPHESSETLRRRGEMVESLRQAGALHSPAVEQALLSTPRHLFLPGHSLSEAYENIAVATRWEQGMPVSSVSQPEIVALMLEQLRLTPGMRALEIGAGAGYNAALLAELVGPTGSVTSIEFDESLASEAATHLAVAGYSPARARVIAGDGWAGWAAGAPWDRIEATVGVWDISPAWVEQLPEGGLLLVPLWLGVTDVSVALRKRGNELVSESWALCGFVRLRGVGGQPPIIRLSNRRSLAGPGADLIAPSVSQLLEQPARRSHWVNPSPGFIPTLALLSGGLHILWQNGPVDLMGLGKPRGRYAIYRERWDGPSLALVSERSSTLLTFGSSAAEDYVREQAEAFANHARLGPASWSLIVRPIASATEPPPPGVIRQRTPHWVYDIRVTPPFIEE